MRLSISLLAALQVSSYIVAAKPFVIISTRVQNVLPTHAILPRQNLLDDINSAVSAAFGIDDDSSTSTSALKTMPPPATASLTTSSKASKHTSSSDDDHSSSDSSQGSASTSSDEGSAATSSSSSSSPSSTTTTESTSTTKISTSTSAPPSTTAIPAPSSGLGASSTATPSSSANSSSGNGVPAGGVAVAVIMILIILAVSAFLVFRYNPRCQAWWAAREERLRQERSYRDAIDGPGNLRQQALSGGASRRRTMLQSFFAPATARLSDSTEIRRKPVNWGAPAAPAVPKVPAAFATAVDHDSDDEKISLTASAAPLGQIERYSMIPVATQLPAPPLPPKPLPSPKSLPETSPTFLPIPASGSFVAELPACVPTAPSPPPPTQSQSTTITRNLSNPHGFGPELPATRDQPTAPPRTPTEPTHPMTLPVSPMSLHPRAISPNLGPVSPVSTFSRGPDHSRSVSAFTMNTTRSNSHNGKYETDIPMLPPLPSIPSLVHAKRGSDGVFRLV